jgi:YD repeat-containing protein
MSSSVSGVEYNYDTASRLTSETRSFGGHGQFTLTYGYNPAGALTSLQDAFTGTVSYSYDRVGQLTGAGASGSGFPSLSSFINNAQYRAWGAAKYVSYNSAVRSIAEVNSK